MICTIDWNTLSLEEWNARFAKAKRAPLLQSYDYAQAVCPLYGQRASWGLIKIDDQDAGLVQIQEAGILKKAIHAIILDRGPVWFEGFGTDDHIKAFFETFARQFPRRLGRRRRIIPEVLDTADMRTYFTEEKYRCRVQPGYQTIWWDIRPDEEVLRAQLKQKWRNMLNKAEKSDLKIEWDKKGTFFRWLLTNYQSDKVHKGYDGPSLRIMQSLGRVFGQNGQMLIGRALLDDKAVAGILILCHGAAATYQIGWSSQQGRDTAAHNLLLWESVSHLKKNGVHDFDLGGINDESAKGVKRFKEGTNGDTVIYLGQYD